MSGHRSSGSRRNRGAILCRRRSTAAARTPRTEATLRTMAKRSRGAARPGQTRPRRGARRTPRQGRDGVRRPRRQTIRVDAVAPFRAADLLSGDDELVEARPAPVASRQGAGPRPRPMPSRPDSSPRARREEYAYVARDVRHIAVVGGGLLDRAPCPLRPRRGPAHHQALTADQGVMRRAVKCGRRLARREFGSPSASVWLSL